MSIRNKVLAAYKKISPATPRQVADYTKLEYKQVSGAVTQLAEQGKLERVSRGVYIYVWDENEKPLVKVPEKMSAEDVYEDVARWKAARSEEKTVVGTPPEAYDPNKAFYDFLLDHGIDPDVIDQIVLLSDYFNRYVAK